MEPNYGPLLPMFKYCLIFRMQILLLTFVKYILYISFDTGRVKAYGYSQMRDVNIIINTANDA